MRHPFKTFSVIAILAVMVLATAYNILLSVLHQPGPLLHTKTVMIQKGASVKTIANHLYEEDIIAYPVIFTHLHRLEYEPITIKYGEYRFDPSSTMLDIWYKMVEGDTLQRKITIPEGWTVQQVVEHLNDNPYLDGDLPDKIIEGTLMPNTYYFNRGDSRRTIIRHMQVIMQDHLEKSWEKRQANLPFQSPQEALILASIVEKETSLPEERARIAAVFINRLKRGMRLQADPTVAYAITQGRYPMERPLTRNDLTIESPYNTYVNNSLPPSPIANPSAAAIEAVLNPDDSHDLYFVVNPDGGHEFSTSYVQHQKYAEKYQKYIKHERKKLKGKP